MKAFLVVSLLSLLPRPACLGATLLVWSDSPAPTPPYTNWNTAAHTIQDAEDASEAGDTVLVTNGIYAHGGRVFHGTLTNRLIVDKPITVRSMNRRSVTVIQD